MNGAVAFHSRRFAFRGAGGEPPQRQSACGVSPVPLIPQESTPSISINTVDNVTVMTV
ncbi:hypothetical protein SD77_3305 [Bacillus badius]|uniref:Ribose 5-phosphate isomerase B n=1 Tax=Bacillus badius TaxID=1455 RepID=A0ABR5AXH5_BACBA|nr:hypothetical protein SD77_3305 [Bacillus badius]